MSEDEQKIVTGEDTQHGKYLTFELEGEVFGIAIKNVTEIIGMQPITSLPETPPHIKGIVNLRGSVIPVIDVRLKFGMEPKGYNDRTCIIVIDTLDIKAGLIVDKVAEVMEIGDDNIVSPPDAKVGVQGRYLAGIGKSGNDVILLLSCGKLFLEEEIELLM